MIIWDNNVNLYFRESLTLMERCETKDKDDIDERLLAASPQKETKHIVFLSMPLHRQEKRGGGGVC